MSKLWTLVFCLIFSVTSTILAESNTYDYIVVGSGPGGGPLAANLAKAGASVLLLEAGDDQGNNPVEEIAGWFFLTWGDPQLSWNFFVKYHTDDNITKQYNHLTWRTTDGQFYVGTDPPPGATMLGVYYPRAATLGGCSTHNALCAILPSNSDWEFIANITGDSTWSASNMRKYFERLENNHYVPPRTPGHGFHGYLDICVNDDTLLKNQSRAQVVLEATAKEFGEDPTKIFDLIQADINNDDPNRDEETGIFGFPAHRDPEGRRVSARNPVVAVANATNPNGSKKYNLNLSLNSFVTKVLFNTSGNNAKTPQAIGVEYLVGQSMYSADPRYNASVNGTTKQAYARKEVILAGGVFNTPQMLKLSGIGPKDELSQFDIPVLVDLPGVGHNMQDNNEFGLTADASEDFVNIAPACTYGAPGDPCLAAWEEGTGPYTTGPLDSIMFKSSNSAYGERDIFMWANTGDYEGYWPSQTVNTLPAIPANRFDFSMVKIHPEGRAGTVTLTSSNPRDMPEINFRFFEGTGEADLEAIAEGVEFGRKVFNSIGAPLGPFTESFPCNGTETCDVKEVIKVQTWSHHATSTCAIGADNDPMAVLDSRFRVRGTTGLRVVDGSAFPRTPGAFPVVPTFMLSEKASDVILQDTWY